MPPRRSAASASTAVVVASTAKARASSFLVLHLGRTRARAIRVDGGKLSLETEQRLEVAAAELTPGTFSSWWRGLAWEDAQAEPLPIIFSCVAEALSGPIDAELGRRRRVMQAREDQQNLMNVLRDDEEDDNRDVVSACHPDPRGAGTGIETERLLIALAGRERVRPPFVTVDFSPALVMVTAVDKSGALAGSLMSPGADSVRACLAAHAPDRAGVTPNATQNSVAAPGPVPGFSNGRLVRSIPPKSVGDAAQFGLWMAWRGGISHLVHATRTAVAGSGRKSPVTCSQLMAVPILATGEDVWATRFMSSQAPTGSTYYRVEPTLLLDGLRILGQHWLGQAAVPSPAKGARSRKPAAV